MSRVANQWTAVHTPSSAAQATITKTGVTGYRHICDGITATIAAGATAQTPINVVLRDGAAGVGAVLWSAKLAAPSDGTGKIAVSGLGIPGTSGHDMTLEFTAAGVTASEQAVTLVGFDVSST